MSMTKILFVCLGNICRSPTAEGILNHLISTRGISAMIFVDSAGTSGWHQGERADARSRKMAQSYGFDLESRSRKFLESDFQRFDFIIGMDISNQENILSMATSTEQRSKVYLLRDFDPEAPSNSEVPDPYYGGSDGFKNVFTICFKACDGLLDFLETRKN
jgi:protein-tyrosine phosphatase